MPAGPIGSVWGEGTWADTTWELGSWGSAQSIPDVHFPEEVLAARLLELESFTDIFSTRVHFLTLPQSAALPAVVLQPVGTPEEMHLRGGSRFVRGRVQCDLYDRETMNGNPYSRLMAGFKAMVGNRAGSAVHMFRGVIASLPTVRVRGIFLIDRTPDFVPAEYRQVRARIDFRVIYVDEE